MQLICDLTPIVMYINIINFLFIHILRVTLMKLQFLSNVQADIFVKLKEINNNNISGNFHVKQS